VVEPHEEDPGEEEVTDEVEDVQRLHQVGQGEERALQRLLPREPEHLLGRDDPARVREGLSPVRLHGMTGHLVDADGTEDDPDLGQPVATAQHDPDSRHPVH
jgi:hypothetical protein